MFIVLVIVSMLSYGDRTGVRKGGTGDGLSGVFNVGYKKEPSFFGALWVQHHEVSYFIE